MKSITLLMHIYIFIYVNYIIGMGNVLRYVHYYTKSITLPTHIYVCELHHINGKCT